MNLLETKQLETKRLLLHKTEESDLKELWNILSLKSVNKYYLADNLNLELGKEKLELTNNNIFCWTIELKSTNEIIGQICIYERNCEDKNSNDKHIQEIICYLEPCYQKVGYASEASLEVLKYLFLEVEIEYITSKVALKNATGCELMDFLGFKKIKEINKIICIFSKKEEDSYKYILTKKEFLKEYFRKEKLYITEDIDKDPYIKHLTDDLVLNLTGESGSGKTTATQKYLLDPNCIVIDTDKIFSNHERDKYNQEIYDMLISKYGILPKLNTEFDKIYKDIVNYYKDTGKTLIIDSALFRTIQDESILVGDIIILRTCINNCFERCINRYKEKNPNATFSEIADYCNRKRRIYTWYHNLNRFIDNIDKLNN